MLFLFNKWASDLLKELWEKNSWENVLKEYKDELVHTPRSLLSLGRIGTIHIEKFLSIYCTDT